MKKIAAIITALAAALLFYFVSHNNTSTPIPDSEISITDFVTARVIRTNKIKFVRQFISIENLNPFQDEKRPDGDLPSGIYYDFYFDEDGRLAGYRAHSGTIMRYVYDDDGVFKKLGWSDEMDGPVTNVIDDETGRYANIRDWEKTSVTKAPIARRVVSHCYGVSAAYNFEMEFVDDLPETGTGRFMKQLKSGMPLDVPPKKTLFIFFDYETYQ